MIDNKCSSHHPSIGLSLREHSTLLGTLVPLSAYSQFRILNICQKNRRDSKDSLICPKAELECLVSSPLRIPKIKRNKCPDSHSPTEKERNHSIINITLNRVINGTHSQFCYWLCVLCALDFRPFLNPQ